MENKMIRNEGDDYVHPSATQCHVPNSLIFQLHCDFSITHYVGLWGKSAKRHVEYYQLDKVGTR